MMALLNGLPFATSIGIDAGMLMQPVIEGKWVFVGALALVLIWLVVMPRRLVGHARQVPPPWRNVRWWAIVICAVQIWIYWRFG